MCVVPAHGGGDQHVCGDGEGDLAADDSVVVGICSGIAAFPGVAYFERWICVGIGAAVFAGGLAEGANAVCGGRADGVDELFGAIGDLHSVFLQLHDRVVWTDRSGVGIGADGDCVCGAGGD